MIICVGILEPFPSDPNCVSGEKRKNLHVLYLYTKHNLDNFAM